MERNLMIEGKFVRLEELQPQHFQSIIGWRNNPENNKFLNQPFKLTMENQTKWYEEKYLMDNTQGLFVMVDKTTNTPFGTIGWTDYSKSEHFIEIGRLLVADKNYRGSKQWIETNKLVNKFVYGDLRCTTCYAHSVVDNIVACKWHKKWGYKENFQVKFPQKIKVNGMRQVEFYRTKKMYETILKQFGV